MHLCMKTKQTHVGREKGECVRRSPPLMWVSLFRIWKGIGRFLVSACLGGLRLSATKRNNTSAKSFHHQIIWVGLNINCPCSGAFLSKTGCFVQPVGLRALLGALFWRPLPELVASLLTKAVLSYYRIQLKNFLWTSYYVCLKIPFWEYNRTALLLTLNKSFFSRWLLNFNIRLYYTSAEYSTQAFLAKQNISPSNSSALGRIQSPLPFIAAWGETRLKQHFWSFRNSPSDKWTRWN